MAEWVGGKDQAPRLLTLSRSRLVGGAVVTEAYESAKREGVRKSRAIPCGTTPTDCCVQSCVQRHFGPLECEVCLQDVKRPRFWRLCRACFGAVSTAMVAKPLDNLQRGTSRERVLLFERERLCLFFPFSAKLGDERFFTRASSTW